MKTMGEILASTPQKNCLILKWEDKYGVHTKRVSEEEIRWLQLNIKCGEFPYNKAHLASRKCTMHFNEDGRLTNAPTDNNCMSLNDDLSLALFTGKFPTTEV